MSHKYLTTLRWQSLTIIIYIYIYIKKEEATVDTIGTKLCHVNFMEYLYNICVVYSITLYFKYLGFLI